MSKKKTAKFANKEEEILAKCMAGINLAPGKCKASVGMLYAGGNPARPTAMCALGAYTYEERGAADTGSTWNKVVPYSLDSPVPSGFDAPELTDVPVFATPQWQAAYAFRLAMEAEGRVTGDD